MRRKERQITDPAVIRQVMAECKVCRLGLVDGDRPYVVPLNYGVEWEGDTPVVYFHCALTGRKTDVWSRNSNTFFEIDCFHELDEGTGETACESTAYYISVMGEGRVEFAQSDEERAKGLTCLMRHQTGRDQTFVFLPPELKRTAVGRLKLTELTCKANLKK